MNMASANGKFPLWQIVKYGIAGLIATMIQTAVFYLLASTVLKCLAEDDIMVKLLGLPAATFAAETPWFATRGIYASIATAIGFAIANICCWLMNRAFVFGSGSRGKLAEFLMFFGVSAGATLIALAIQTACIDLFGMMTSYAVLIEIAVSFSINYLVRKFFIFR